MKKLIVLLAFMTCLNIVNAQNHHWTPISGNQYNMDVKGKVTIDGVVQNVTTLEVGAFCGDECRASELVAMFPVTQEYLAMLTIRSNVLSGETITFRLYDHALGEELDLECENIVEFVNDAVIGTIGNWYEFTFTTPVTPPITNTTSGDWSNPETWGGTEPTATANVQINTGDVTIGDYGAVEVTVASLNIASDATLTIESGSTLIVTGDMVSGSEESLVIKDGAQVINESANVKATAEKDVTAYTAKDTDGWYLISSSVNEMAIAGSDFITETYDLYRYNEAMPGWENYRNHYNTDFMIFENGRGYLYANSNTFSPDFKGVLNYDDVTVNVTYTDSKDGLKGVNIIGNPFPHVIYKGNGGAIDNANLASGYYSLSFKGAWQTCTYDDPIQPGQGILVRTSTSTSIVIEKTNAEAATESSTSKDNAGRMKLMVSGSDSDDRVFAYFSEGIGLEKMANISESIPSLSIRYNNTDYAIAHIGEQCDEMDVIFNNSRNDDFTIAIEFKDIDFEYLHLIDNATGDDIDLLIEPSYTFHATGNEIENRFKIVFRDCTGIDENAENTQFAYIAGENLIVRGEGTLQIIDMAGRLVETLEISGLETVCKPSHNGVYILKLNSQTQKIVVR